MPVTARLLLPSLLLLVPFTGALAQVERTVDEFTGNTHYLTKASKLSGGGVASARVELRFQKFVSKAGVLSYQIFVNYKWSSWMFIESGASLLFLVDGDRLTFSSDDGSRGDREAIGGDVYETAMYEVAAEDLRRLANAHQVKVRIIGSRWNEDREFTSDTFKKLRAFLHEAADDSAQGMPERPVRGLPADPGVVADFSNRVQVAVDSTNGYVEVWQYPSTQPGGNANKWGKKWCTLSEVHVDVRGAADAAVPLVGIVDGRVIEDRLAPLETRTDADSAHRVASRQMFEPIQIHLDYAQLNGRWVLVNGTYKAEVRADPDIKQLLPPAKWDSLWTAAAGKADTGYCMVYRFWGTL
jgi:hypothetical protein